uniref:Uncharacterized protein n=1 Tax=Plectus sambesii TaxID=2011161 RepID=A0A914WG44_9BILA
MRRSTGPCTELLGAPDRTGTDLFFRGPSITRSGPELRYMGKNCNKRSTDRTVDRRYWTVDRRYLVLDRGTWCWTAVHGAGPRYLVLDRTGTGPTPLSLGPNLDRDRPNRTLDRTGTGIDLKNPGPTHL